MKNLKPIFNLLLFPFLFILFSTSSHAVTLTDDFETDENGWSTNGTSIIDYDDPIDSDVLRIDDNQVWKSKTYSFGSSYANQSVTIDFDMWAVGSWESSGEYKDYFYVWADGGIIYQSTIPGTDGSTDVVHKHFSFTSTTDNNGDLVLAVGQVVSAISTEKAHVDNFSISIDSASIGCDDSLDTTANSTAPYTIITAMHNITTATTKCISGSTADSEGKPLKEDYYHFTVAVAGTLDITTLSPNGHEYKLRIGSDAKGTQYYGEIVAEVHNISTINLSSGDTVYIYVREDGDDEDHYQITFNFTPVVAGAVGDTYSTAFNTSLNANVLSNDTGSGLQVVTASTTSPSNGTVTIQTDGSFTYTPTTGYFGPDNFEYTIEDSGGNNSSATVNITVNPAPVNQAPVFTSSGITSAQANIAYTYTITASDPDGDSVSFAAGSLPSWLTLTGNTLSGTPLLADVGAHIITLIANDGNGGTATQSFTITVTNNTNFEVGLHPFILVNPPATRNINGNLAVAGNTVMCLTENTTTYGGTCDDSDAFKTSNNYISKFIDIDDDSRTWNSTSSYINFPDSFDPTVSKGILWAGLFWQGRFSTDNTYPMRYGMENGTSYNLIEMGQNSTAFNVGGTIDVESLNAHLIKLKVNNGIYNDARASTVYTYSTSNGTTYAAYADVTSFVRESNLSAGDHNFTVANLTTNEGREGSPGVFGGWSLLVIYQEDGSGHPRNISAYHGFQSLSTTPTIEISGFKLPSSGPVDSQAVVFSGEGEHLYGKNKDDSNSYDWMKISNINADANYDYLPGPTSGTHIGNRDNMFNGQLTGILRADIPGQSNNLQVNNDGVDIDRFNVSNIMETYRDANPDTNKIFLRGDSNNDYITPSMIAFATELYVPKVCFDYTVQVDAYDITDNNRSINAHFSGDLSLTIALQNEEGDFDFTNSQIGVRLVPDNNITTFQQAFYAPNNVNTLIPAIYMPNSTPTTPRIGIGEDVTLSGGIIKRNQRYFVSFDYFLSSPYLGGKFEVDLNTTIDFGSGAVPIFQSTENGDIPRCPQSNVYNPIEGAFNIERVGATGAPEQKFPLYTQIVGKDFDFELVAYNQSATPPFSTEVALNDYTVDLELINASPFNDDRSIFTCSNPNPNIIQNIDATRNHLFVQFPVSPTTATSRIDLSPENIITDSAIRNAAFRVWYIVDKNNTILKHDCVSPDENYASSNTCFQALYDTYLAADDNITRPDGSISSLCGTTSTAGSCSNYSNSKMGTSGCYACLHDFFSKSVCSRDNFSIRPASYRIHISDSDTNTTSTSTDIDLGKNDSSTVTGAAKLAAGYPYKLTGMATSYLGDTVPALSYNKILVPGIESSLLFDTTNNPATCADMNNTAWDVAFNNGYIQKPDNSNTLVEHHNVGNYKYNIQDINWTLVDQANYAFKTFPGVNDCIVGDNSISATGTGLSGCITDTNIVINNTSPATIYTDLQLTYKPYQFDVSDLNYSLRPDNRDPADPNATVVLFMNDFDNIDYYAGGNIGMQPNLMAAVFEGNVSAQSINGTIVSNYTTGCAANDVRLNLYRTTTPTESLLESSPYNTQLQQYLQYGPISSAIYDQQIGRDKNLTLPAVAFEDAQEGVAVMQLYTTFKKPLNNAINPIQIQYNDINATGDDSNSSAHMITHIPKGTKSYDTNVTYVYGKISPQKRLYNDVLLDYIQTPLYVDIYCDLAEEDCNTTYGLSTKTSGEDENAGWYLATLFANNSDLGTTDIEVSHFSEEVSSPQVIADGNAISTINTDVDFDDAIATQNDVNISVPVNTPKSTVVKVEYKPVPWLIFNPAADFYRVRFTGQSGWAGVGDSGYVTDTSASKEDAPRMNW